MRKKLVAVNCNQTSPINCSSVNVSLVQFSTACYKIKTLQTFKLLRLCNDADIALLLVLANYSMQCFSHSHALIPIPMHFIPIPIPRLILFPFTWESHGIPGFPFPCTSLFLRVK